MPRRLLTTLLGGFLAAWVVVGAGVPATAAKPQHHRSSECRPTVEESAKAATAVFIGMVSEEPVRQPRPDGLQGAVYLQTVTVSNVYRGDITTESVQVQTDRNRGSVCNLGSLEVNRDYVFFVSGTGQPWVASSLSGTRLLNDKVSAEVVQLLGAGQPPIKPPPETAVFTPVDTGDPTSLSRRAAPGAALLLVGLLGLVVVRFVRTRR